MSAGGLRNNSKPILAAIGVSGIGHDSSEVDHGARLATSQAWLNCAEALSSPEFYTFLALSQANLQDQVSDNRTSMDRVHKTTLR